MDGRLGRDRLRVQVDASGGGRTRQSFKAECDINNLVAKYQKTGAVDHFAAHGAQYATVPAVSFTAAMNLVTSAQQMFNDLPSKLRKKFGNSPRNFLEFVQDPDNADEMRELGLAENVLAPGVMPDGPGDPVREFVRAVQEAVAAPREEGEDPPAVETESPS